MAHLADSSREIRALEMVSRLMDTIPDINNMLLKIMEISREILDAEAASVLLYDPQKKELYFEVALGRASETLKSKRLGLYEGIAGYVARTGRPVNIADVRNSRYFNPDVDSKTGFVTRSLIAVPLKGRRQLLGVIEVLNKKGDEKFSGEDLALVKIIAAQASMAVKNARLYEESLQTAASRRTRAIREAFQTYVPPGVADELLKHPDRLKLGGRKREISILFADIKGFSSVAEELSPEELVNLVNNYLTPMSEVILLYKGTIDKYIGDSLMAFFGDSLPVAKHAQMAVSAALQILKIIKRLNRIWEKADRQVLDLGIGINTGDAFVGNIGSHERYNYTVMGDNVNIAQRLQELTRRYGNSLMISEFTWRYVKGVCCCREIDRLQIKGRKKPVRIYEPVVCREEVSGDQVMLCNLFNAGLEFYRANKLKEAEELFRQILKKFPDDGPSLYYMGRISAESPDG